MTSCYQAIWKPSEGAQVVIIIPVKLMHKVPTAHSAWGGHMVSQGAQYLTNSPALQGCMT